MTNQRILNNMMLSRHLRREQNHSLGALLSEVESMLASYNTEYTERRDLVRCGQRVAALLRAHGYNTWRAFEDEVTKRTSAKWVFFCSMLPFTGQDIMALEEKEFFGQH